MQDGNRNTRIFHATGVGHYFIINLFRFFEFFGANIVPPPPAEESAQGLNVTTT